MENTLSQLRKLTLKVDQVARQQELTAEAVDLDKCLNTIHVQQAKIANPTKSYSATIKQLQDDLRSLKSRIMTASFLPNRVHDITLEIYAELNELRAVKMSLHRPGVQHHTKPPQPKDINSPSSQFDGEPMNWATFWQLFSSSCDVNPALTDLRVALKPGEVADLARSASATDDQLHTGRFYSQGEI